jgi:hypothetical protein
MTKQKKTLAYNDSCDFKTLCLFSHTATSLVLIYGSQNVVFPLSHYEYHNVHTTLTSLFRHIVYTIRKQLQITGPVLVTYTVLRFFFQDGLLWGGGNSDKDRVDFHAMQSTINSRAIVDP